jgi:hypothetical protein
VKGLFFLLNVNINDANVSFLIGLFWNQHSSEILKLSVGNCQSLLQYQRVSSKEKQVMGDIITSSVRGEQPSQLSSIMPPHSTSRLQLMPPRLV